MPQGRRTSSWIPRSRLAVALAYASVTGLMAASGAHAITAPLARGADVQFTVDVDNTTPNDIPLAMFEGLAPLPWIRPEYSLATQDPSVCTVSYGDLGGTLLQSFALSATNVPAQSFVACTIHVHRSTQSYYAFGAGLSPASYLPAGVSLSDTNWIIGPIADLSIESQQVDPFPRVGKAVGIVRIAIGNKGPWDVKNVNFGYCQDVVPAPFHVGQQSARWVRNGNRRARLL